MSNPSRVAFSIFGRDIYWYAICVSLGLICAVFLALKSALKYKWTDDDLIDVSLLVIPMGIVGARLYYVAFEWEMYANNLISIFFLRQGGLAIYGGIIGGFIAGAIYCRVKKKNFLELMDICAPSVALGQAIGRWGNFFNQEAFGAIVTNKALMWFPFAVKIDATNTIHYATFFYESMWCLLIVIFLLAVRGKFKHAGDAGFCYLMLYSFERMIIEGLRTDSLMIGNLRVSQLLSGALFLALAAYMIVRRMNNAGKPILITNKANPAYLEVNAESIETTEKEGAEQNILDNADDSLNESDNEVEKNIEAGQAPPEEHEEP